MLNAAKRKILRDEYKKEGYATLMKQILEYDYPLKLKKDVIDYVNKLHQPNPIKMIQDVPLDVARYITGFLPEEDISSKLLPLAKILPSHYYYNCKTPTECIRDFNEAVRFMNLYKRFETTNDLTGTQFRCDMCLDKRRCRQCKFDLSTWIKDGRALDQQDATYVESPDEVDREFFLFDQQR